MDVNPYEAPREASAQQRSNGPEVDPWATFWFDLALLAIVLLIFAALFLPARIG